MGNSDEKPNSINDRVRYIRKFFNLSQSDFAKSIGIKQATLSDIERGKIGLSTSLMSKISDEYFVNVEYILTGKESLYFSKDRLIDIEKRNALYNRRNIVNSDNLGVSDKENEIDGETLKHNEELNFIIRNKLRTVEFSLMPLAYRIANLISYSGKDTMLINEERYFEQFNKEENKKKRPVYSDLPIANKVGIIKEIDFYSDVILDKTMGLLELLENKHLPSSLKDITNSQKRSDK